MVKTKGGRSMNPTDAYRKEERRKQVNRNKLERKFQREAHRKINNASSLKAELSSIIVAEENGALNKTLRLKKKVLQDAYDQALRKQKETEIKAQEVVVEEEEPELETVEGMTGYTPTPLASQSLQSLFPVPSPPPLPPGEPPVHAENVASHILPPPVGIPPGFIPVPPPPGPPPGVYPLPPPLPMYAMHMPQYAAVQETVPPVQRLQRSTADVVRDHKPTITAAPTVVKKPLAQNDKAITSMVPASVKIKREQQKKKGGSSVRKPDLAPGASAAPRNEIQDHAKTSMEQKMSAFLSEVEQLGAFDTYNDS